MGNNRTPMPMVDELSNHEDLESGRCSQQSALPQKGVSVIITCGLQAIKLYLILALQYIGFTTDASEPSPGTLDEHPPQHLVDADQKPPPPTVYAALCESMWAALEDPTSPIHSPSRLVSIESPTSWKQRRDRELQVSSICSGGSAVGRSFLELRNGPSVLELSIGGTNERSDPLDSNGFNGLVEVSLDSPTTPMADTSRSLLDSGAAPSQTPHQRWAENSTAVARAQDICTTGPSTSTTSILRSKYERAKRSMLTKMDYLKTMIMA